MPLINKFLGALFPPIKPRDAAWEMVETLKTLAKSSEQTGDDEAYIHVSLMASYLEDYLRVGAPYSWWSFINKLNYLKLLLEDGETNAGSH